MKPALRVMLCDDAGERFFGEGPCRLLHLIEETGSLRSAAAQMGLSYSKALRLVQHAEKELGFALTCKTIGGRASLAWGSNGQGVSASLAGYGQHQGFDWLVILHGADGKDYKNGDGEVTKGTAPAVRSIIWWASPSLPCCGASCPGPNPPDASNRSRCD